jgi:hypothetical protein
MEQDKCFDGLPVQLWASIGHPTHRKVVNTSSSRSAKKLCTNSSLLRDSLIAS